ncbi:MAG: trigger factor [bacterium]
MDVSQEKLAPCLLSLNIKVEKEKTQEAIAKALDYFCKRAEVPGFRKGKAPLTLVRRYIGEARLKEEASRILAEEVYKQAIAELDIHPYTTPEIEIESFDEGEDALIKAKVYTQPVVNLPPYDSIEVEYKEIKVKEDDIKNRLDSLRHRFAEAQPLKRKEVKRGDVVDIAIQVFLEGKPYRDEKKDRIIVGDESLIPPIDVHIEGMKLGEEKEIEVRYPEDFNNPELAGKTATLRVRVEGIYKLVLPKLDDEFAKKASEFNSLEELKENIRQELEREAKKVAEEQLEREIISRLISLSHVEFPEPMLQEEVTERFKRFMENLERHGYDLDRYLSENNLTLERLQMELEKEAKDILVRRLVLQEIGRKEGIKVSEEDINKRIEQLAQANRVPSDTMRRILEEMGKMEEVIGGIFLDKVLEFLKKSVKIRKEEEK